MSEKLAVYNSNMVNWSCVFSAFNAMAESLACFALWRGFRRFIAERTRTRSISDEIYAKRVIDEKRSEE